MNQESIHDRDEILAIVRKRNDRKEVLHDRNGQTGIDKTHDLVKEGEKHTAQGTKLQVIRSLESTDSPYNAGAGEKPIVSIDREKQTLTTQGILWDVVDIAHSDPFPNDIEAVWQNATLFMVAVGCCKALASDHTAATKLHQDVELLNKAFWSTLFAGQIRLCDMFHEHAADKDKMVYKDWLPRVNPSWTARPPILTPLTSGLLELAEIGQQLQGTWEQPWAHKLGSLDLTDRRRLDPKRDTTLISDDWSTDDIIHYSNEFDHLAAVWQQQPFDLYHRPFQLLNVVPDPYWGVRKHDDPLAKRKSREHHEQVVHQDPVDLRSGVIIPQENTARTSCLENKMKNEVSMDPKGTLDLGLEKYALGRRFFVTKKGYFGLGPQGLRPGDRVAIMFGLAVPLILRKYTYESGLPGYEILGESYVHGIMEGEVLRQWRNGYVEAGRIVLR